MCHGLFLMSAARSGERVPRLETRNGRGRGANYRPREHIYEPEPYEDIYEAVDDTSRKPRVHDNGRLLDEKQKSDKGASVALDIRRPDVTVRPQGRVNLSHTIKRLRMCGWYWGDITSNQAKVVLRNAQNGSFILRDSTDACHLFSLSLKANNMVVSVRVAFSRGMFKLDSWNQEDSPSFFSVVDMIDYYLSDERHKFYVELPRVGEFPVCLKHPIWKNVPSLQDQCRYGIVKCCRTSQNLRLLPLPVHLVRYLLDFSPEDPDEKNGGEHGEIGEENETDDVNSAGPSETQV